MDLKETEVIPDLRELKELLGLKDQRDQLVMVFQDHKEKRETEDLPVPQDMVELERREIWDQEATPVCSRDRKLDRIATKT